MGNAILTGQSDILYTRLKSKIIASGYACSGLAEAKYFVDTLNTAIAKPASGSMGSLNSNSWDYIDWASRSGIADALWSVGDRKAVSLGAWGNPSASYGVVAGTYYCFILGFNHNSSREGNNKTHFAFGFTALSGGIHVAFCGGDYGLEYGDTNNHYPRMNVTATNSGGWASTSMRNHTLNSKNNLMFGKAIPADLDSVLKTVTKYTDNVGGGSGSVQGNVTATTDRVFLLSPYELRGDNSVANTYEPNYTEQYQYYKNGNSKQKYRSYSTGNTAIELLRSPAAASATEFTGFNGSSGVYAIAKRVYSVCPAFCV